MLKPSIFLDKESKQLFQLISFMSLSKKKNKRYITFQRNALFFLDLSYRILTFMFLNDLSFSIITVQAFEKYPARGTKNLIGKI